MLAVASLFSVISVCVKLASEIHNTWKMVFWRNRIGLLVLIPPLASFWGWLIFNEKVAMMPGWVSC
jgi:hypothetical protein